MSVMYAYGISAASMMIIRKSRHWDGAIPLTRVIWKVYGLSMDLQHVTVTNNQPQ